MINEMNREDRQRFVKRMLLLGDDGMNIPPLPEKVLVEHTPTRQLKKSYNGFKFYLVFVALCFAYVVLS